MIVVTNQDDCEMYQMENVELLYNVPLILHLLFEYLDHCKMTNVWVRILWSVQSDPHHYYCDGCCFVQNPSNHNFFVVLYTNNDNGQ